MKTIKLPFNVKSTILACGADMKGAFALAKGDKAYLFDGFGDLSDLDNFMKYEEAVRAAEEKLKIKPQLVVCDLHPDYFSTQFAEKYNPYKVQHHEAHIASAIVDNNIKGTVLGVAFDGTGYGTDGKIWGGEFFVGNAKRFKRAAHLKYIPMPSGEICIKEPWRMAASYIYSACGEVKKYDKKQWAILKSMIEKNINSPMTSSVGRLFDAVGSIVLNKEDAHFEAELPIELEKIADKNEDGYYGFDIKKKDGPVSIDMSKAIRGILKDMDKRVPKPKISAKFHNTIAFITLKVAETIKIRNVVLSGGVFQNNFLSKRTQELFEGNGFKIFMNSKVETNDSGIPLGQIAIADARLSAFAINKK